MRVFVTKILSGYRSMPLIMAVIAAIALGIAFISQYQFGLQPCNLCVWQRWPYAIVIVLGVFTTFIHFYGEMFISTELDEVQFRDAKAHQDKKTSATSMILIGLTLLANSIIALYHSGVERKWWVSFLEGCSVPTLPDDPDEILAHIHSISKAVRCDEIPWADPVLELSMANYNVIFCLGLAVICFLSARLIWKNS